MMEWWNIGILILKGNLFVHGPVHFPYWIHHGDTENTEVIFFCWIGRRRSNKSPQPCGLIFLLIYKFGDGMTLIILPAKRLRPFRRASSPARGKIILLCVFCASSE